MILDCVKLLMKANRHADLLISPSIPHLFFVRLLRVFLHHQHWQQSIAVEHLHSSYSVAQAGPELNV